jgi:hypothetical protein
MDRSRRVEIAGRASAAAVAALVTAPVVRADGAGPYLAT